MKNDIIIIVRKEYDEKISVSEVLKAASAQINDRCDELQQTHIDANLENKQNNYDNFINNLQRRIEEQTVDAVE